MGWFNKKEKEGKKPEKEMSLPELPELPKLPDLTDFNSSKNREPLHKLPSFPNSSFGDKFSQNTIKEAVKGYPKPISEEEEDEFEVDGFQTKSQMTPQKPMPKLKMPERKPIIPENKFITPRVKEVKSSYDTDTEEFPREEIEDFSEFKKENFEMPIKEEKNEDYETSRIKRIEPVFIRIDKFEASLKAFEKTKKDIADMEKILKDIAEVKEEEEKQLQGWQQEIMHIKSQIDKIDKDIFSKVE